MTVALGQRYGTWTVISDPYVPPGKDRRFVDILCVCGAKSSKAIGKVKAGASYCAQCFVKKDKADILVGIVYHWYVDSARKRGIEFNLTKEQLKELIFKNCSICGTTPKNRATDSKGRGPLPKYNGIDRIVNDLGYSADNVQTCCRWCNEAKRAKSVEEFDSWIEGIVKNYNSRNRT